MFIPALVNGEPSTNHLVIVCYGEHVHPPPPPHRVPPAVKERIIAIIKSFGTDAATARKLASSPILPIMLDGKTTLTQEHVSLANQDVVNRLIKKERLKEFPWGTDYLGAMFLMRNQSASDQYIRSVIEFDDGKYMVHCQSVEQSKMLVKMSELQCDKTFKRTRCREFEINGYDPVSCRLVMRARVFFDGEDDLSYFRAFTAVFDQAEKDTGTRVPWGHLYSDDTSPVAGTRIKAIIVDMSGGQVRGLALYFKSKFPADDEDFHILQIVKVCRVHFLRSIRKKEKLRPNEPEYQGNVRVIVSTLTDE